ncbi:MAG: HAMP domain-containing histidine kinase [Pelomonas sp.]|nr:HAMP domain-containing histidine kinase [Roseateles sp.]
MAPTVSTPGDPRLRRRWPAMVLPLVLGNALVLVLCIEGMALLSAARAYVGGESLWSKSRAIAVRELRAYGATGSAEHLKNFELHLDVPLADHEARRLMAARAPDLDAITAAFMRGGVAADDVPQMVHLYRWFGETPLLRPTIAAWEQGDIRIARIQRIGEQLQIAVNEAEHGSAAARERRAALADELDRVEDELVGLEQTFSAALAASSRAAFDILSATIVVSTAVLTLFALLVLARGLRREARDAAALRSANRRWQLAADSDSLGVFEWWSEADEVHLDRRACMTFGFEAGADDLVIAREQLFRHVDLADARSLRLALDEVVAEGGSLAHRFRVRATSPDGAPRLRYVEITGTVHDAGAGVLRLVGITRDASERVAQERLASDKLTAERVASARMQFLSRLSHELRTPLNAVLGLSELLSIDPDERLSAQQHQRVGMINAAGKHLLHLVDDVLDISRIDAGRFSLECGSTELEPVIRTALALNVGHAQDAGARLEVRAPAGVRVWADPQRLGQVLTNLLSNACKYNRPGGRVVLDVLPQGEWVEIAVSDEGAGISEADLGRLFQPFQRLAATAQKPGTGLGLTIVKLLVEQMGGGISVRSTPGQGSVFTVNLRAMQTEAAHA